MEKDGVTGAVVVGMIICQAQRMVLRIGYFGFFGCVLLLGFFGPWLRLGGMLLRVRDHYLEDRALAVEDGEDGEEEAVEEGIHGIHHRRILGLEGSSNLRVGLGKDRRDGGRASGVECWAARLQDIWLGIEEGDSRNLRRREVGDSLEAVVVITEWDHRGPGRAVRADLVQGARADMRVRVSALQVDDDRCRMVRMSRSPIGIGTAFCHNLKFHRCDHALM